jgi:hypothetical protein
MEVPTDQIPAGWFAEPASERLMGLPRTGSSSRLNAQAPEFVPRGPPPPAPTVVLPPPSQVIRMFVVPPPPPPPPRGGFFSVSPPRPFEYYAPMVNAGDLLPRSNRRGSRKRRCSHPPRWRRSRCIWAIWSVGTEYASIGIVIAVGTRAWSSLDGTVLTQHVQCAGISNWVSSWWCSSRILSSFLLLHRWNWSRVVRRCWGLRRASPSSSASSAAIPVKLTICKLDHYTYYFCEIWMLRIFNVSPVVQGLNASYFYWLYCMFVQAAEGN